MKAIKHFLIFCIVLSLGIFTVKSQTWFPVNAEWTYQTYTPGGIPFPHSITSMKCTKDTVIEGNIASIIVGNTPCSSYGKQIFHYNATENIVYIFINEEFKPYFDFSKKMGESYFMYFPNIEYYTHELPYDSLEIRIDSITNEVIDGMNIKIQHITTNSFYYQFRGPIIEYIGGADGFYPESETCDLEVFSGLHCYFDEFLSYYSNPIYQEKGCDYVLQTNVYEQLHQVFVYPNPANGYITLKTDEELAKIEIYNFTGQCVLSKESSTCNNINIQTLPNGNYYIKATFITGSILINKFIKL